MPKISVIIPVYNTADYLPRCLNSIIRQTFSDLEIVCVNDGSTDSSADILQEYAKQDKRIKIITQKNGGLSVARNTGLKNISGEYVSFIDSDDWIDIEYYEHLISLIDQNDADIAVAAMRSVTGRKASEYTIKNLVTNTFVAKVANLPNGSVCNKLFKTKLFDKIEFPQGRYYEDNIVLIKTMFASNIVVFTNYVSYYYFMNQTGICRTTNERIVQKRNKDRLFFAQEIMNYINSTPLKNRTEVKDFIVRTVVHSFISKHSSYYKQTKRILGRWYINKLKAKRFLKKLFGCRHKRPCNINDEHPCIMGKYTYYGSHFRVVNKLSHIGHYCSIGKNVQIGTSSHFMNTLTTSPIVALDTQFMHFPKIENKEWHDYNDNFFRISPFAHQEPVSIGNDVWIGNNVIIMDGIRIGHGAIIGTGSIVTHDVPPYAVVAGVPANIVKYRFDKKTIDKLLRSQWWNMKPDFIATLPFHDVSQCIRIIENFKKHK